MASSTMTARDRAVIVELAIFTCIVILTSHQGNLAVFLYCNPLNAPKLKNCKVALVRCKDYDTGKYGYLHNEHSISRGHVGVSHIYLYRNSYIAPRQPCSFSVSERFAGFESMSDALLGFLFTTERDEGFALQIENVLLAD